MVQPAKKMKILLTTSRNPTPRIRTFCNDLAKVIPDVVKVNRGKLSMDGVAEKTLELGADKVIIVDRWHGGPGKIGFFQVGASGLMGFSPALFVAGIRLQREFGHIRLKPTRSLAITTPSKRDEQTVKVATSLSRFFNVPIFSVDEKPSEYTMKMQVSYNTERRIQITFVHTPQNVEVGPRITLSHIVWETSK